MNEDDRRELEMYRQWMDMRVYVTDDNRLQCNFVGCPCGQDLELPGRRTTMRDVAAAVMEHRVKYLGVMS